MSHGLSVKMILHQKTLTVKERPMTQDQYLIRRKLNIIDLAEQLGNISEACRKLGVGRRHYYDVKQALRDAGIEGLLEKVRNKPRPANRVDPEIEQRLLALSLDLPIYGQISIANELKKEGLIITASAASAASGRGIISKPANSD